MRTYRELFRTPEFTPLFATAGLSVAASTVSGLALGILVHSATGSPLLSALAMFGPSLAQVVGALTLLSAADRVRPRAATTGIAAGLAATTAVSALPGMPVWAIFAILGVEGLIASVAGGIRYGLLHEILAKDGYLLGRSVLNMAVGVVQIVGFALGGVLVALLQPRGALLAAAALSTAAAIVARLRLTDRRPRATGRPSAAATLRVNARLWSSAPRRGVYLALWVPNGLVVGCESLYVSYDSDHAGLFFACAAAGMLAGDTLAGRFLSRRWRERLGAPLRLLLAAPYLLFALAPPLFAALAAVTLASLGYAAGLLLQERLLELTPEELTGQALGLHSSGMLALQGIGALTAGTIAELTTPATAMATAAAASLAVTAALAPRLRARRPVVSA
ncbi:MFS transporter [Yinghuangia sp. ASG 101]|uniref:MFS transporter n=1 Tax=Yinghuangia sp. ASG 101 TaxID=2896848 RepID=UPI001E29CBFA|nr:MFS transporter [Yinghuangia sp. ASG 101]UGQ11621.1 MFS transporter [Yinghuangia sp. ASG 101]